METAGSTSQKTPAYAPTAVNPAPTRATVPRDCCDPLGTRRCRQPLAFEGTEGASRGGHESKPRGAIKDLVMRHERQLESDRGGSNPPASFCRILLTPSSPVSSAIRPRVRLLRPIAHVSRSVRMGAATARRRDPRQPRAARQRCSRSLRRGRPSWRRRSLSPRPARRVAPGRRRGRRAAARPVRARHAAVE